MYKIILVCCLVVLAVAEGRLIEDKIKLEQQRYSQILQNYATKLNNSRNDFHTKIEEIQQNLLKMSEINTDQNGECPTKYEDIKKMCFYKIQSFCNLTLTVCHTEFKKEEQRLWDRVITAKDNLRDYLENFEVNIADCKNTYNISTSDYEMCVTGLISIGNEYVNKIQNFVEHYSYLTKEYVQDQRKAALAFLGKTYETKTCTSSSVYINNKWYPIYENAC